MSNSILNESNNEKLIIDFLEHVDNKDIMHALFVVNLDDFAGINEKIGYDNASELLFAIEDKVRMLFRGTDIVFKGNGDEYIILINNPGSIMNVENLCSKMLHSIAEINISDINLTASIGVSLFPVHGTNYQDLKAKAIQSLARIKADGKNGYRIYDAAITKTKYADNAESVANILASMSNGINTNSWNKYFDDICFKIFKDDTNLYSSINAIMEIFCLYYGFGRAFIVTSNNHTSDILNKMHFCIPGCELPSNNLIDALKEDLICRLYEGHGDYGLIDIDDADEDPEVISFMQTVGDSQILYFSMYQKGQFIGGVVFENTDYAKIEIESIEKLYYQVQEVFSYGFLIYDMNNESDIMSKIEIFEGMDAYIYIFDKKTREINFMNKKALLKAGTTALGRTCHEVICNKETPCIKCPLYKLRDDDSRSNAKLQLFNMSARCWTINMYSWLSLKDNPGKILLVCVDVDNIMDDNILNNDVI